MTPVTAARTAALLPCRGEPPALELLASLAGEVGRVLVVRDGMSDAAARELDLRAGATGAEILRLARHRGKGYALRAGVDRHVAERGVDAVLTVDADGQHPPAAIPAFLAASAEAELVIGNRFAGDGRFPWQRRLANRSASAALGWIAGGPIPDSQCGMRLLRGRALAIPIPAAGFESETIHLRRCLRAGVAVAWVSIPAIYEGAPSSFRALRDSARVAWAVVRPGA